MNPVGAFATPTGIWLWDDYSSQLVHLDPATNTVKGSIAIGDPRETKYGSPKVAATDGTSIWTADVATHTVLRIDPATDAIADRITLGKDPGKGLGAAVEPFGLAVSGTDLWVSDFDQGVLVHVDTAAKRVVDVIALDRPEGIAIAFGSVWVIEHRTNTVVRIDPATKATIRIVLPGAGGSEICGMCVDKLVPGPDSMWVPLNLGRGIARIDPTTNTIRATIPKLVYVIDLGVDGDRVWAIGGAAGPVPCVDTASVLLKVDPATDTSTDLLKLKCAASVAALDGDVWIGTVDAAMSVIRVSRP